MEHTFLATAAARICFRRSSEHGGERSTRRSGGRPRTRKRRLSVYTGVPASDGLGPTICFIIQGYRIAHRNLDVRGPGITKDRPRYLEEAAILRAFRTLHGWFHHTEMTQEKFESRTIHAGDPEAAGLLGRWDLMGSLGFETAIASLLINDMRGVDALLRGEVVLLLFALPIGEDSPGETPLIYTNVLRKAEEFRTLALPKMGEGWT